MRNIWIALLLVAVLRIDAQEYAVSLIPETLKENANAVIRMDNSVFKILSIDKAEYSVEAAVTILNEKGRDMGDFVAFYDKLSSISGVEITVYDKFGDKIRKIKSADIADVSAVSGGTLYDDSRVLWMEIEESVYPYTVEYKYDKKFKFLYAITNKFFYPEENVSVEQSSATLVYPPAVGARYKEQNFNGSREESISGDIKSITWKVEQLPSFEMEPYGPAFRDAVPAIRLAPAKFSFEGYEGDMSTWAGIAEWQKRLNEGRETLPEGTLAKIREMTDGKNTLEKIKAVYEYVQKNTRYVSVQLGVGGFQPFPAKVVDEVGYGDCKALSFYTQSLLRAANVPSYYTWVYGGPNPPKVDKDFPDDVFNHIILCVPHEKDTVWLECTSQTNPFGFQGSFTGNRDVFVINEQGGKIVRTNYYGPDANRMDSKLNVKIDEAGDATVSRFTNYQGIMAEGFDGLLIAGKDKQKEWIQGNKQISTFEVKDFSLKRGDGEQVNFNTNLQVSRLLSKSGTRMFLQPNIHNKNSFVPQKLKERKTDIFVKTGRVESDTIIFDFPPAFRVEATFDPIIIKSEFGEYRAEVQSDENGLRYIRYFRQNDGRFKSEAYADYLNFHKEVVNADKRKIALISGT